MLSPNVHIMPGGWKGKRREINEEGRKNANWLQGKLVVHDPCFDFDLVSLMSNFAKLQGILWLQDKFSSGCPCRCA